MGNPVTWFEITGRDGAKLQSFYSELFDWKMDTNNAASYGVVDTGGAIGGGVGATADGSAGPPRSTSRPTTSPATSSEPRPPVEPSSWSRPR